MSDLEELFFSLIRRNDRDVSPWESDADSAALPPESLHETTELDQGAMDRGTGAAGPAARSSNPVHGRGPATAAVPLLGIGMLQVTQFLKKHPARILAVTAADDLRKRSRWSIIFGPNTNDLLTVDAAVGRHGSSRRVGAVGDATDPPRTVRSGPGGPGIAVPASASGRGRRTCPLHEVVPWVWYDAAKDRCQIAHQRVIPLVQAWQRRDRHCEDTRIVRDVGREHLRHPDDRSVKRRWQTGCDLVEDSALCRVCLGADRCVLSGGRSVRGRKRTRHTGDAYWQVPPNDWTSSGASY